MPIRLIQLTRQLYVAMCAVCYFTFNEWKYSNTNTLYLTSLIPPENRDTFSFDYSSYDIKEYIK